MPREHCQGGLTHWRCVPWADSPTGCLAAFRCPVDCKPNREQRVYCQALSDLIESPEATHPAGRLKTLTHPALLVVDQIGCLTLAANGARLVASWSTAALGAPRRR